MNPYLKALPLILAGVLLNAFAQIAMKKAVSAVGMEWTLPGLFRLFLHPWMLACLGCYAVSVVLWAGAMHLVTVNFAYPFLAFGFVAGALMARWILGESIPPLRWVAMAIIVLGVSLQAFTGRADPAPGTTGGATPSKELPHAGQ
jgi:multidrug transporter EmrE-like cation transporter